jgi:UDP-N-acetylglucosamine 2-epimerase (non-hydrolysing)
MTSRPCVFVLGTRAQLVKVAPVLRIAAARKLPHVVWFTGQHRESIDDLIDDFGLTSQFVMPTGHLERSSVRRLLGWAPGMLLACRRFIVLQARESGRRPLVVVHGDTLSTFLGALAAKLSAADVVHLESGLSSGSLWDPFPEELLRTLTFRLARHALCPNPEASARMRRLHGCAVVDTQENTLLDSVRFALEKLPDAPPQNQDYFVASVHRFQNLYQSSRLADIVEELVALSRIAPVHFVLHPATQRRLVETGLMSVLQQAPGVRLAPRMPYTQFLSLLAGARGVISDGGSNQEELSYLGVPTVLFRERTERPDGVGRNIVFERDLAMSLADFVRAGAMDRLRAASVLRSDVHPSECSVRALAGWAAA